jgi:hypothetical protein
MKANLKPPLSAEELKKKSECDASAEDMFKAALDGLNAGAKADKPEIDRQPASQRKP